MRAWCVLGLLLLARAAFAQPAPAGASGDAAAAFEAGRKLLAQHRPAEACTQFARAIAVEPGNVGVMLNLGLCNEQLDKQATALTWFRRALVRASERQLAESARAAGDKIAALSRTVATLRIALSPPAAGAAVTVDGAAVSPRDLARVEIDAGHHVIAATAGAIVVRQELDIVDGATTPVELVVPAAAPAPAPAPRPPGPVVAAQPREPAPPRWHTYAAGATGAGLVLGSVALGLVGRSAARASEHPDTQRAWQAAARYGGTSMFVVGSAALGWAVWRFVRAPDDERAHTYVAPIVGERSAGIGVQGAF